MKFCTKCGKELYDEAVICPECGCSVSQKPEKLGEEDKVDVGFVILSVFIPLFGIIWWAVKAKETPKAARACGIAAIISWVASFVFTIVFYLVFYFIGYAVSYSTF